jgi:hypothetical protein
MRGGRPRKIEIFRDCIGFEKGEKGFIHPSISSLLSLLPPSPPPPLFPHSSAPAVV